MKTRSRTRGASHALDDGTRLDLLEGIEAGLHRFGVGQRHLAVAVEGIDADGVDVAVRELDAVDVVEALVGLHAPDNWLAFGVVCEGRARSAVEANGRWESVAGAAPYPVRVGVLIDRSGSGVAGLRSGDAGFELLPSGDAFGGRVPDACRRVLGLATPPPDVALDGLWSIWWAERVLGEALRRPGELTWSDVVSLHPGVSVRFDDKSASHGQTADVRLEIGHRFAVELEWGHVRRHAAHQPLAGLAVRPEAAGWMDDGMFSREVLGGFAPLRSILAELEPVVAPDLRRSMERSIRGWATG